MFDAFLELEGVDGESTRKGFEGMIELDSFDLGALNPSTIGTRELPDWRSKSLRPKSPKSVERSATGPPATI